MKSPTHPRGWLQSALLAVVFGVLATGCTVIPQREFQAYRKAFDETRAQSENILADHAAARHAAAILEAQTKRQTNPDLQARSLAERLELTRLESDTGVRTNDFEIRLQAWAVIASYNEALLAVASGAKSADVEGAVNGFLATLQKFPVKEVVKLAGEAAPYAGVVTELISIIQREVEARRFRNAVLRAEQPMAEFVGLLKKDAALFRTYRVTLLNRQFDRQEILIIDRAERLRRMVTTHGWSATNASEVDAVTKQASKHRILAAGVETFPAIPAASTASPVPPDEQQAVEFVDLRTLADGIARDSAEAVATVNELAAYHELMRQYGILIGEFERSLAEFAAAARKSTGRLPSVAQLQQVASTVRLAQKIYSETK